MNFCDLHCDTPSGLFKKRESLTENSLHISLSAAQSIEKYVQCAAIWSDRRLSDSKCFDYFVSAAGYFSDAAGDMLCRSGKDIAAKDRAFILTVEDARLLCGNTDRLKTLYAAGVRILTLCWKGESIVGGGWDTECGLSDFGREVVFGCFEAGIIPDVSHASDKVIREVYSIAKSCGKSFAATHSNAYAVFQHRRNLTPECIRLVTDCGGIIGVSMYPPHLCRGECSSDDVFRHISYYINAFGADNVALGCDFDGIDETPSDIRGIGDIPAFFEKCAAKIGYCCADKIFFSNAYNFLISNI